MGKTRTDPTRNQYRFGKWRDDSVASQLGMVLEAQQVGSFTSICKFQATNAEHSSALLACQDIETFTGSGLRIPDASGVPFEEYKVSSPEPRIIMRNSSHCLI